MKAGRLSNYIYVYEQQLSQIGCLGAKEVFVLKGACWAKVSPFFEAGNNERFVDRKILDVTTYRILTRFNIDFEFLPTDIVRFKDKVLRIDGIANKDEGDFTISVNAVKIDGDSVDFLSLSGMYDQEGLPMYNQEGEPMYNQEGV